MKRRIPKASTSFTDYVLIRDTAGSLKTGLAFNTAGLKAYYVRDRAAAAAITLVTLGSATAAWSSGGFIEVDATNAPGLYRVDYPNALLADGSDAVRVVFSGASGMTAFGVEIELTADVPVVRSGTAQAGATATITLDAGASAVDNVYRRHLCQIIAGTGAGQAAFATNYVGATKVLTVLPQWQVQPDATSIFALRSFGLDAVASDALVDLFWDELLAGHLVPGSFGARFAVSHAGTAQGGSTSAITLAASASAQNDYYRNQRVLAIAGAGAGQSASIATYNGTTKVAQLLEAVAVAFDATTVYLLIPEARPGLAQQGVDAILDAPITKPSAVPSSWSLRSLMGWLGAWSIFKKIQPTGGPQVLRNDDDTADLATATTADSAGTYTRGKQT